MSTQTFFGGGDNDLEGGVAIDDPIQGSSNQNSVQLRSELPRGGIQCAQMTIVAKLERPLPNFPNGQLHFPQQYDF